MEMNEESDETKAPPNEEARHFARSRRWSAAFGLFLLLASCVLLALSVLASIEGVYERRVIAGALIVLSVSCFHSSIDILTGETDKPSSGALYALCAGIVLTFGLY